MLIVTVRQSDGLPGNVGAADGSKASVWRRLVAPNADYIPVTGLSSKGIASTGAAPTGDCAGHTKSHAVNALFLRELVHGANNAVPANSVASSHFRAQCLDEHAHRHPRISGRQPRASAPSGAAAHDTKSPGSAWFLAPERAAFEAAVRGSKLGGAA